MLSELDNILRNILPIDQSLKRFMIVDLTSPDTDHKKNFDTSGYFWPKTDLRDILNSIRDEQPKYVFTYSEVCSRFSKYILENQSQLFDERNPLICHCANTKLHKALRVASFHRRQIHDLLQSQLKPLKSFYIKSRKRKPLKRRPNFQRF